MTGFEVLPGDVIVSCAGTIGETFIMPENMERGIINQALMRMRISSLVDKGYFLYYFDHVLKKSANALSNGSAMKNIPPFSVFKQLLIPLPPIEEQKRIVLKLDDLSQKIETLQQNYARQVADCAEMRQAILREAFEGRL
jgi:type I restriction enzyme S subunit